MLPSCITWISFCKPCPCHCVKKRMGLWCCIFICCALSFSLNLLRYQDVIHIMGKLWSDPCKCLALNCIYKNMTLRCLGVWLTNTLHCQMKKDLGLNPLVWQWKGTWLQWYTSLILSCDFSHIPAPLRCTPPTHPPTNRPKHLSACQVCREASHLGRERAKSLQRITMRPLALSFPEHCCTTIQ